MQLIRLEWAVLSLAIIGLAGCGSASSAPPQPTLPLAATAPPLPTAPSVVSAPAVTATAGKGVTIMKGGPTIASAAPDAAISGFSDAVTFGNLEKARAYLTPALQASVKTTPLPGLLGLQNAPTSYLYRIDSESASRATATVTYQVAAGTAVDSMTLVHTLAGWLIDAISPTSR